MYTIPTPATIDSLLQKNLIVSYGRIIKVDVLTYDAPDKETLLISEKSPVVKWFTIQENGEPMTAHTTAPVPFVLLDFTGQGRELNGEDGALCDICPTLLNLIDIKTPSEMTGKCLM